MRLGTLLFLVLVIGVMMGIARDEVGRVALIVFVTGIGLVVSGTTAIMALFQTVGALGEARGLAAHAEAMVATAVVLAIGSSVMLGIMFVGALMVNLAVP